MVGLRLMPQMGLGQVSAQSRWRQEQEIETRPSSRGGRSGFDCYFKKCDSLNRLR